MHLGAMLLLLIHPPARRIALELIYSGHHKIAVCGQKQHLIMIMNYEVLRLIKTSFNSPEQNYGCRINVNVTN